MPGSMVCDNHSRGVNMRRGIILLAQAGILPPSFMDTPSWMQGVRRAVVERRREQAAEESSKRARFQLGKA